MCLFNLIVVGVLIVQLLSIHRFITAIEFKTNDQYKTRGLNKFIEWENATYYNTEERKVQVISGEHGKSLEF